MLKTEHGDNTLKRIIKSSFGDITLWYTTLIMMTIMYHYRSSLTFAYGAATLIIGAMIFRLFDFIKKHKMIGAAAYAALFLVFMMAGKYCIAEGSSEYPISFGIWFLTPQDALDYSRWYTLAIYLFFMIFMASVIYYFTKVRYRIFMNFLIFIIPFAIYGKEYEKMPTVFIMLLAIGYVVLMIFCRQLSEDDGIAIIGKRKLWQSVTIYTIIFASIAAIFPKPDIEADRAMLEELISAEAFTDKLLDALSVFRDTSSGEQFRSLNDETILYFVRADEDLRLKTSTFSIYDYDKDTWSVSNDDTRFSYTNEKQKIEFLETGELLEMISLAAETDSDFAQEYGLEKFSADDILYPQLKQAKVYTIAQKTDFAPVPPLVTDLLETSYNDEIAVIKSGLIYCVGDYFNYGETFTYEYSSDTFFDSPINKSLADSMSRDDYYEMLYNAYLILSYQDDDKADYLMQDYLISSNFDIYLDYGGNDRIYSLAQEITKGLESDYDKAKAIEAYFIQNDYYYDKDYRKAEGENAEDFIFEVKRGVCYEYATAMVLLSRAAGIPARYAEGYNMFEKYDNNTLGTNYVIKSKAAHGFPELYIRGVGWMSFEPTVSSLAPVSDTTNASGKLYYAGIFLIIAALIFLLAVKLFPIAVQKFFLIRIKRVPPTEAVIRIMRRICDLYKIDTWFTSHETADLIAEISGIDISRITELFDRAAYSGQAISDLEKEEALEEYLATYEAFKKQRKRTKIGHKRNLQY